MLLFWFGQEKVSNIQWKSNKAAVKRRPQTAACFLLNVQSLPYSDFVFVDFVLISYSCAVQQHYGFFQQALTRCSTYSLCTLPCSEFPIHLHPVKRIKIRLFFCIFHLSLMRSGAFWLRHFSLSLPNLWCGLFEYETSAIRRCILFDGMVQFDGTCFHIT